MDNKDKNILIVSILFFIILIFYSFNVVGQDNGTNTEQISITDNSINDTTNQNLTETVSAEIIQESNLSLENISIIELKENLTETQTNISDLNISKENNNNQSEFNNTTNNSIVIDTNETQNITTESSVAFSNQEQTELQSQSNQNLSDNPDTSSNSIESIKNDDINFSYNISINIDGNFIMPYDNIEEFAKLKNISTENAYTLLMNSFIINKQEIKKSDNEKEIIINSSKHIKGNIKIYTTIPNIPIYNNNVSVFWINENKTIENLVFYDDNNDSLYEKISWEIPHLSDHSFLVTYTGYENATIKNIQLNVIKPLINEEITNFPINFSFNISYNDLTSLNCTLYIKDNKFNIMPNNIITNLEISTKIKNGTYNWNLYCNDKFNSSIEKSINGTFIVNKPYIIDINLNKENIKINEEMTLSVKIIPSFENITSLIIDFNDGQTNYSYYPTNQNYIYQSFYHKYQSQNNYTISIIYQLDYGNPITLRKYINVTYNNTNKDSETPKIYLISPDNNAVIRKRETTFSYKAEDNVKLSNCTFELYNITGVLGILEYSRIDYNLENNRIIDIPMQDFDNGDYKWYINCYDNSTNFNEEKREFTIILDNSPNTNSNNENLEKKNLSYPEKSEVNEVINNLNDFINKQSTLTLEQKEALEDLGLIKNTEYYKKRLNQIDIDLGNNIKFISDINQREKRKKELLDELKEIKSKIPKGIEILKQQEFIKNSISKELPNIIEEYYSNKNQNINKKTLNKLSELIYSIQNDIQISTKIKQLKIEYSDKKDELTLITKNIKIKNDSFNILLEIIPKKIKDSYNIKFINEITGENNSRIKEINIQNLINDSIIYYIEGLVEPKELEETDTILYKEYDIENLPITGFSILKDYEINWYYSIIISILLIFIIYLTGLVNRKIKISKWKREENVVKVFKFIKEGKRAIKNNDIDDAKEKYHKIREIYPLIPDGCKKYVYKDIKEMRIFLDKKEIDDLIKEYKLAKKQKRINDALRIYKNIKETYKKLPKKYQKIIYHKIIKN